MSYANCRVCNSNIFLEMTEWSAYRRFTFLKMQYIEQEFQPSLFIASYTSKGTRVHVFSLGYFAAT